MAVIAIYSVKGGVGKTTLAANLAWCAAAHHKRSTLLWDLDLQGGASFLFGVEGLGDRGAAGVADGSEKAGDRIWETGYDRLDLLPADDSLRGLESRLAALGKGKRLAKRAEQLSREYERIFLDCPPALNETSAQVVRAADLVIVPLPPSPLSARALDQIQADFKANHKAHPPILPVLSMLDLRRKLHRQMQGQHASWPVIPNASVIERGAERQMPVGAFAPSSPAAESFARLARAIEKKLKQVGK